MPILMGYQIVHNAYSDIPDLLKGLAGFFADHHYDFYESGISEKDTGIGSEIQSEWIASREVTDYIKFHITIMVLARDVRKVRLPTGEDTFSARLIVRITTKAEKNWNETFSDGHWQEMMRQLYERYIKRGELDKYKGRLYGESMALLEEIKTHLK